MTPQTEFITKDTGERQSFSGGMVRDLTAGKIRPDLAHDGPMFLRWVSLLYRGLVKYAPRNWMKAKGKEEFDRFLESADRHYTVWFYWRRYGLNLEQLPDGPITRDPLTEDHAAAVFFNINGVEYVAENNGVEGTWKE